MMDRTLSKTSIVKVKISAKHDELETDRTEYFQEAGNWRNIIFLPHNILWKSLVVFTLVMNSLMVSYNLFFYIYTTSDWFTTIYYIFEVIYFGNVVLVLMHRFMAYQKTQVYVPKPIYLVIIDVITLLPYYEVYYLLKMKSTRSKKNISRDYLRPKVLLRLTTVIHFFYVASNQLGLNHIVLTVTKQIIVFCFYTIFVSGLWYKLTKWPSSSVNWTRNLKYYQFNKTSMVDWYFISASTIGNCLAHNWSGVISAQTTMETIIVSLTMVGGYLMHVMILFGQLMTQYIKKIEDQFEFSYRLHVITRMLDNWYIDTNKKNSIIDAYNIFWEKRKGQKTMPMLFYALPTSLQTECTLDTFWHFIQHARIFGEVNLPFVRRMSRKMKSHYHMPGEYLYQLNEMKVKLVYIVSGVVQILSQEDQESPVMSFSGGTVLSELCCLMTVYSNVNIRCATYCEIQTLDIVSFSRLLIKFPNVKQQLHKRFRDRLAIARTMQHEELVKLKNKEQRRTSIRWIKTQWRNVMSMTKNPKRALEDKQKYIVPHHISKYLHLYVLSDDVETKVSAICLRSQCPFVFEPSSTFRAFCDYIVLCATMVQCLMVPYIAVFHRRLTLQERGFLYMVDVIFIVGLYIEMSTAVNVSGRLISKITDIIIYKVKQKRVLVDILSTIPFELILFLTSSDPHLESLMHLNRTLRIYRLFRMIILAELNVWVSYIRIRLMKFSFLFILILYFLSCFTYMHTCYKTCEKIGWYHYNKYLTIALKTNTSYDLPPFIRSFDFVASVLLALTWTNNYSYSIKDIIVEQFITLLGYFLFSFCFAELGACAVLQLKAKREYQHYLKGLKYFMIRNNVPHSMRDYIYTVVQCQWQYNDRFEVTGPQGILSNLPTHMLDKVFIQRLVKCMKFNPLFMHCEDSTLTKIANLAKVSILPPGTIVMRENTIYTDMNFILRGYCKVESSIPTDKYHKSCTTITYGECFPVLAVLMELKTFLKVTTVTSVELITIRYDNLIVHLKTSLDFYADLQKVLEEHMNENYLILTRQKGRLPKLTSKKKSKGVGDFFMYETNEQVGVTGDKGFDSTFNTLGKWKFIKHFLLKRTFIPTNKFYTIWEIVRCCAAFAHVIYVVFFMKFSILTDVHRRQELIFIFFGVVDFYIRMHTCYYNKDGILISHPLYTAKNYIRSSFLVDLFCIFPHGELKLHHMFGQQRKNHTLLYMANVTRPLLFYRIFNGITYIQEKSKEGRAILFHNIKYILLVFVLLGVLALFMEGLSCPMEDESRIFVCSNNSWLANLDFVGAEERKAFTNTFVSYYVVLSVFATSVVGLYTFRSKEEIVIVLLLTFILFGTRWLALAKITSSRIGGNTMLVHYQNNMKNFLKFTNQNYVSKFLTNEIVSHFEHIWKKTKGHTSHSILHSFHAALRADFSYYLYSPCFKLCEVFVELEVNGLRHITSQVEELHFKKDAHIIRCNDIGSTVYIVHKGLVDIRVANDKLCTLSSGGMFGCLAAKGITRQTICAKAVVHVDLLAIKSTVFNKNIADFPSVKKKLRRTMFLNSEYILPIRQTASQHLYAPSDLERNEKASTPNKMNCLLISAGNSWYHAYNFVVNVHIATISSILVATLIVGVGSFDIFKYKAYMYIFDVLFYFKITICFHLSYIDPESGVQVKEFKAIWKRYIKSVSGFWLDMATCLPFEVFASHEDTFYRLGWLNRTFRFLFMIKYYNNCRYNLTVSKHLRWSYLIYTLILLMHTMVILWWKVSCTNEVCKYIELINHEKTEFVETNSTDLAYRLTYQYVINIFTGTGLRNVAATSTTQLIVTVIMVCVAQFTQLTLTIGFATMLLLEKFVMLIYEKNTEHVLQYVKATNLSLSLKDKIWKYFVLMWTISHGVWIPELIKTAPPYLKQDIMAELYGKYITNHFLFRKTHIDFIRQLVVYLEMCVYMPGMYITQKGDQDDCMYFIEEGEVIVYDVHGEEESELLTLTKHKTFGEPQGLYGIPHDHTYKARFVCKILVLKRKCWLYLLDWFPASREYIIEQAARHFKRDTLPTIL